MQGWHGYKNVSATYLVDYLQLYINSYELLP